MKTNVKLCAQLLLLPIAVFFGSTVVAAITETPGSIAGEFSVSNLGAATYTIPIDVPPGINGMAPSVALSYNSQSGDGIAGQGWSLSGLSAITRCPNTKEHDDVILGVNLTVSDRFCIDGKRLLLENDQLTYGDSTYYRTEIEEFTRFELKTSGGAGPVPASGPRWFIAETADGKTINYGQTEDSRIFSGDSDIAVKWLIKKIKDPNGNYIKYYYDNDETDGVYRITRIEYTGTATEMPVQEIKFLYETRTGDVPIKYYLGASSENDQRLESIETWSIDAASQVTRVRTYELAYVDSQSEVTTRSKLASVQECTGIDASQTCYAPTIFDWDYGLAGWSNVDETHGQAAHKKSHAMDLNGDGIDDLVIPSSGKWKYHLGQITGGFAGRLSTGIDADDDGFVRSINYDGDAKRDLIIAHPLGEFEVLVSTGTSFTSVPTGIDTFVGAADWSCCFHVADYDGDGLDDLMLSRDKLYVHFNNGNGFDSTAIVMLQDPEETVESPSQGSGLATLENLYSGGQGYTDFNGDLKADLLLQVKRTEDYLCGGEPGCIDITQDTYFWVVFCSDGSSFDNKITLGTTDEISNLVVGDFNGDGLPDIAAVENGKWKLLFSDGGPPSLGLNFTPVDTNRTNTGSVVLVVDYDGDGKSDLMIPSGSNWNVLRSDGETLEAPIVTTLDAVGLAKTFRVMDINGDGMSDVAYIDSNTWDHFSHNGDVPDRITKITDGLDNTIEPFYTPATDGSVYTATSTIDGSIFDPDLPSTAFPTVDYVGAKYLVDLVQTNDGIGDISDTSYHYYEAKVHVRGYGDLGFAEIETTLPNGLISRTAFHQTHPFIGMAIMETLEHGTLPPGHNGEPINSTIAFKPRELTYGTGAAQRHLPYVDESITKTNDLDDGSALVETTTTIVMDSATGRPDNVTQSIVNKADSDKTDTIVTTYVYDSETVSNWCIGLPNKITVAHTTHLTETKQRVREPHTDLPKCRIKGETIEKNSVLKAVTTLAFDTWGNVETVTVTGTDVGTDRITTIDYDAAGINFDGYLVASVSNELSHQQSFEWDYGFGLLSKVTDQNSLITDYEYDEMGRLDKTIFPDGSEIDIDISACAGTCDDTDAVISVSSTHSNPAQSLTGRQQTVELDSFGRQVLSAQFLLDGTESFIETQYDGLGRVEKVSSPFALNPATFFWNSLEYDAIGRITKRTAPENEADTLSVGRETSIVYNGLTTIVTFQQSPLQTKTYVSDALGQIVSVTETGDSSFPQVTATTTYSYDPFGNLDTVTDPLSNITNIDYNLRGWKSQIIDLDTGQSNFEYNGLGELIQQTHDSDPSLVMDLEYDVLGRLEKRIEPEGTTNWFYDPTDGVGLPSSEEFIPDGSPLPDYNKIYSYDSLSRLEEVTYAFDSQNLVVTNEYDNLSRIERINYPESFATPNRYGVEYEYDNGHLKSVKGDDDTSAPIWVATSVNPWGRVNEEVLRNGITTDLDFDIAAGQLMNVYAEDSNSAVVQDLDYLWDVMGNLEKRIDQAHSMTEEFRYDGFNRVREADVNSSQTLTVLYDAIGNILSKTGQGTNNTGTYSYLSSKPHAVTSIVGAAGQSLSYDGRGNMTMRGGKTILWSSYNKPDRINGSTGYWSEFSYGPNRSRYKQVKVQNLSTTTVYYAGRLFEKVVTPTVTEYRHAIFAGGAEVATYVRRSDSNHDMIYHHRDHLGSVESISDESGTVTQRMSFDVFGQRRSTSDWIYGITSGAAQQINELHDRGYTDHEQLDNVGLTHMNGRVYDPGIGRFLSADPIVQSPFDSQSFNRYSYVWNNPLAHTDPTGFCVDLNYCSILDGGASRTELPPWDPYWEPGGHRQFIGTGEGSGSGESADVENKKRPSVGSAGQFVGPITRQGVIYFDRNILGASVLQGQRLPLEGLDGVSTHLAFLGLGGTAIVGGFGKAAVNIQTGNIYWPGWQGGSRGRYQTFELARAGRFLATSTFVVGIAVDGYGAYRYFTDGPESDWAIYPGRAITNTGVGIYAGVGAAAFGSFAVVPAAGYFVIDTFYPGGFPAALEDSAETADKNRAILGDSFNLYRDSAIFPLRE